MDTKKVLIVTAGLILSVYIYTARIGHEDHYTMISGKVSGLGVEGIWELNTRTGDISFCAKPETGEIVCFTKNKKDF